MSAVTELESSVKCVGGAHDRELSAYCNKHMASRSSRSISMSILERAREIAVMRVVGALRTTVSLLFTIEAAMLGFWGCVIGLGLVYAAVLVANPLINKQLTSNNITSSNSITLPIWLILGVVGLTTVIGILAGLYPARPAAHLDPVEAFHYK